MTTLCWEIYELPQPRDATLWDKLMHAFTPSERKHLHKTRKTSKSKARKSKARRKREK